MSADRAALIEGLALSPVAMVATNPRRPDNPLEVVNPAFCQLTGYAEAEIVGRNCRFLAGADADPAAAQPIREAIAAARPLLTEVVNFRADGRAFRNGLMITPLFDDDGQLAYFIGSQVDLGEQPASLAHRRADAAARVARLPARRRQVLQLMARGRLNKQIAWELGLALRTVKMHRALLLEDLGVATSAEAIRIAVEAGV